MSLIIQRLRELAAENPEAIAVTDKHQRLSRVELIGVVQRLAKRLKPYQGKVVALLADNQVDWLVTDLACLEAGVILLPLPAFFSDTQQHHALAQSGTVALIGSVDSLHGEPLTSHLRIEPIQAPTLAKLPDKTVKITFTSGSTGKPKGVCLSEQNQLNVATSLLQRTGLKSPRHLCVLPLPTLLENIAGVYAPLLSGGEVILLSANELGFNGASEFEVEKLAAVMDRVQPDSLILLPGILSALVAFIKHGWQAPDSLKFVAVGGSRVGSGLLEAAEAVSLPVYEGYGLSECSSVVSLNSPHDNQQGSTGMPLPHIQVSIENEEICVSGNAFLGYINEPESWYPKHVKTGDIGSIDDKGFLHILGRRKNLLINSFGRNINPEWIESEILANPLIAQCVVYGDARPFCIALIYPRTRVSNTHIDNWLGSVNQGLPVYARIKHWLRLPAPLSQVSGTLTANGKPVREQIERLYQSDINTIFKEQA